MLVDGIFFLLHMFLLSDHHAWGREGREWLYRITAQLVDFPTSMPWAPRKGNNIKATGVPAFIWSSGLEWGLALGISFSSHFLSVFDERRS